ncbi:transport protein SEC9 [Coccidioides immitis H538.4]|uniref:Transport protein SEC9 n=1 Tax=Coccidioides immitis H538.4 TaxID=396776 RepID=A0A0J8UFX6_COCIT|nr:transport protein SEC9 [Coccidioides immitis H538.4]
MRKLGFGKKGEDGDDDNRRALFGSRSKAKSPAPQSNPYAQPPGYSDPYTEAKSKLYGYGGPGNADPNAGDDNRNALFGDARQRFQERQQQQDNTRPPPYSAHAGAENESGAPGTTSGGYGAYQDRQLTAEEEEEEDVQAIKQEIRFMKQQDVSSTRNALRVAAEAEETGRSTLARLGAQGERIHNTEKNLDLAANQNRIADEKSRELKKLNKSMFAMHVSNPFTSAERRRARDEAIISRHQDERFQREETRLAAFRTEQRLGQTFKEMEKQGHSATSKTKTNLAERSKYHRFFSPISFQTSHIRIGYYSAPESSFQKA